MTRKQTMLGGTSNADFAQIGIARDRIEPWEDGARTDGRPGTYEWWYVDAVLDDGSTLVVGFYNKEYSNTGGTLSPWIRINLDMADGRRIDKIAAFAPSEYSAAIDHADVRIGGNHFSGDLHTYYLHVMIDDVEVDLTLVGHVPPWRPETGHLYFGEDRAREFAWLPAVPQGSATVTYRIGDETHNTSGIGYHDHNWGNIGLDKVIHHWYWARGQAGPYSVIASNITSHQRYDYASTPVFMLARDGEIMAGDSSRTHFEASEEYLDEATGKPVFASTCYTYDAGGESYVVTFTRQRDLSRDFLIDTLSGVKKFAARLLRFDGAYLRFAGEMTVQYHRDGAMVEEFSSEAMWELMYLGRTRR